MTGGSDERPMRCCALVRPFAFLIGTLLAISSELAVWARVITLTASFSWGQHENGEGIATVVCNR